MTIEGVLTRDCEDWGSCRGHLMVEDGDFTGSEIRVHSWNALDGEIQND